jgi:Flp pilus assembly secretin CpaC
MRKTALLALAALLALPVRPAAASAAGTLALQTGHSTVLNVTELRRVAVGDPTCLGVVAVGTSQLVLNGKAPCHTTLYVWSADGAERSYAVMVTSGELDLVSQALRSAINQPDVQVEDFGKGIILRGTVPDMAAYVQLQDIIDHFSPFAKANNSDIVNAVTVSHSLGAIQQEFAGVAGVTGLQIEPDGHGNIIVSGNVPDGLVETKVIQRAQTLAGPFLAVAGQVVDRLTVAQATEIDVKVQVLEIDTTGLSQLGLHLQSATFQNGANGTQYTLGGPSFPVVEAPQPLGGALKIGAFFRSITLAPTLDLLINEGHARILSEPDIVALPGTKASFLVGGSIPYAYSTGLGQVSIQFKDYGVQLNMVPTLLSTGSIRTDLSPDISDLDYANAVSFAGYVIPALKESKITTSLVTKPGQSIVMGGLLRHLEQKTIDKIPLLSSIPILGKLFQSTRYQTQQSDVVFVMTPTIINQ